MIKFLTIKNTLRIVFIDSLISFFYQTHLGFAGKILLDTELKDTVIAT